MNWWAKVTGIMGIVAFLETNVILLLDKSMALPLLLVGVGVLIISLLAWAPLVTKSRAHRIVENEAVRHFPNTTTTISERETVLKDGEWFVAGYVHYDFPALGRRNGAFRIEARIDSGFGRVLSFKPEHFPW